MNIANLRDVYNNVAKKVEMPDFDTFAADMTNEGNLQDFYGTAKQHFELPDYTTFKADMGVVDVKKKELQPSIEQPIVSSESVLQPSSEQAQFGNLNAPPPAYPIVNNPDGGGLLGALKTKQEQPSVVPAMATQATSAVQAAPAVLTPEQERDNRIGQKVQANLGQGFSKVKSESKAIRDEFADNDNTKDAVSLYSNMFGDASMFNKDLKGDVDAFTPIINKQPTTLTSIKDIRENNIGSIKADDNIANSIWVDYVKEIDNTETPKTPDQVIIDLQKKYNDISPVSFYPIVNDLQDNYVKNYLTEVAAAKTNGKLSYTGAFLYDDYFDDGKRQLIEKGFSERDIDDAISQFKEDNYVKYANQVDSEVRNVARNEIGFVGSDEELTKKMSELAIADGYKYMNESERKIAAATIELNRLRGIEGEGDKTIRGGSFKTGEYSEQKSSGKTEKDFIRMAQLTEQLEALYKEAGTATVYDLRTGERIQDTSIVESFNQAVQIESERLKGTTAEVLAEAYKDSWQQMKYLERRAEWDDSEAMDRKMFEAQAKFQAASKAYLLNSSVENVDKNLSYLFGVATNPFREGFGLEPTVHERDILSQTERIFNDYNISTTETEKEKFKTTFGETVFEMGGGVVPMVIQMAVANKVLGAAGFAEFVGTLSKSNKALGLITEMVKEDILFQATGGEPGMGAGFALAGKYVPNVFAITPESKGWKAFANQIFKADVGATGGMEAGNVVSAAVESITSDKDFMKSMDEYYGKYSDVDKRILAGLVVNAAFGLSSAKKAAKQKAVERNISETSEYVENVSNVRDITTSEIEVATGKNAEKVEALASDTKAVGERYEGKDKEVLIARSEKLFQLAKDMKANGDSQSAKLVQTEANAVRKIEESGADITYIISDKGVEKKVEPTKEEVEEKKAEEQAAKDELNSDANAIRADIKQQTGIDVPTEVIAEKILAKSPGAKIELLKKTKVGNAIRQAKIGDDVVGVYVIPPKVYDTMVELVAKTYDVAENASKGIYGYATEVFDKFMGGKNMPEDFAKLSADEQFKYRKKFVDAVGEAVEDAIGVADYSKTDVKNAIRNVVFNEQGMSARLKLAKERANNIIEKSKLEKKVDEAVSMTAARKEFDGEIKQLGKALNILPSGKNNVMIRKVNNAKTPTQLNEAYDKLIKYLDDAKYQDLVNRAEKGKKNGKDELSEFDRDLRPDIEKLLDLDPTSMTSEFLEKYVSALDAVNKRGIKDVSEIRKLLDEHTADIQAAYESANLGKGVVEDVAAIEKRLLGEEGTEDGGLIGELESSIANLSGEITSSMAKSIRARASRIKNVIIELKKNGQLISRPNLQDRVEAVIKKIDSAYLEADYIAEVAKENAAISIREESNAFKLSLGVPTKTITLADGSSRKLSDMQFKMVEELLSNAKDAVNSDRMKSMSAFELEEIAAVIKAFNSGNITPQAYKYIVKLNGNEKASKMLSDVFPRIDEIIKKDKRFTSVVENQDAFEAETKGGQVSDIGRRIRTSTKTGDKLVEAVTGDINASVVKYRVAKEAMLKEYNKFWSKYYGSFRPGSLMGRVFGGDPKVLNFGVTMLGNQLDSQMNLAGKLRIVQDAEGRYRIVSADGEYFIDTYESMAKAEEAMSDAIPSSTKNLSRLDYYQELKNSGKLDTYWSSNKMQTKQELRLMDVAYNHVKKEFQFKPEEPFVFKDEQDFIDRLDKVEDKWLKGAYENSRKLLDSTEALDRAESTAEREGVSFRKRKYYWPHKVVGLEGLKSDVDYMDSAMEKDPMMVSTKFGNVYERTNMKLATDMNAERVLNRYIGTLALSSEVRPTLSYISEAFSRLRVNNESIRGKFEATAEENLRKSEYPLGVNIPKEAITAEIIRLSKEAETPYYPYLSPVLDGLRMDIKHRLQAELAQGESFAILDAAKFNVGSITVNPAWIPRKLMEYQVTKLLGTILRLPQEFGTNTLKVALGGAGKEAKLAFSKDIGTFLKDWGKQSDDYKVFLRDTAMGSYFSLKQSLMDTRYLSSKMRGKSAFAEWVNNTVIFADYVVGKKLWKGAFEQAFEAKTGEKIDYKIVNTNSEYRQKFAKQIQDAVIDANSVYERMAPSPVQFGRKTTDLFGRRFGHGVVAKDIKMLLGIMNGYSVNEAMQFTQSAKRIFKGVAGKSSYETSGETIVDAASQMLALVGANMTYVTLGRVIKGISDYTATTIMGEDDTADRISASIANAVDAKTLWTNFAANVASLSLGKGGNFSRAALSWGYAVLKRSYLESMGVSEAEKRIKAKEFDDLTKEMGVYSFISPVTINSYGDNDKLIEDMLTTVLPIVADAVIDIRTTSQRMLEIYFGDPTATEQELEDYRKIDFLLNVVSIIGYPVATDASRIFKKIEATKRQDIKEEEKAAKEMDKLIEDRGGNGSVNSLNRPTSGDRPSSSSRPSSNSRPTSSGRPSR